MSRCRLELRYLAVVGKGSMCLHTTLTKAWASSIHVVGPELLMILPSACDIKRGMDWIWMAWKRPHDVTSLKNVCVRSNHNSTNNYDKIHSFPCIAGMDICIAKLYRERKALLGPCSRVVSGWFVWRSPSLLESDLGALNSWCVIFNNLLMLGNISHM